MEFKQNKIFICLAFILLQALATFSSPIKSTEEIKFTFIKPENWENTIYAYIYTDNGEVLKEWPGVEMTLGEDLIYYKNVIHKDDFFKLEIPVQSEYLHRVIFSDGKQQIPEALKEGFPLVSGYYDETGLLSTQAFNYRGITNLTKDVKTLYYKPRDDWKKVYAHHTCPGNYFTPPGWTTLPGHKMFKTKNGNYVLYYTGVEGQKTLVAFNDGNPNKDERKWDNNNTHNFEFTDSKDENEVVIHTI